MLNRLTVSVLLKAVIAITSVCVVIALSLTAYESWDRLKTANRISHIADASADLFKAMHNLRTDRSTTNRLLNATEPMDGEIEKYLRALRDAQMPAMARALELLPTMDFPQSGTLVPELARLFKLLTEEQKQFWEDVAKPKDSAPRRPAQGIHGDDAGPARHARQALELLAATVNHQDATIDQLLSIKQNAWLLRNTAGEASLIVSTGLAAGKITPEGRYDYTQYVGGTSAMWKALELSTSGMQLPAALASAMAAAKTAYFEPQYLALRDRLADVLVKGEKPEMTANQWSPLTVGRMASAVAVAEGALDAAKEHTQEQRGAAQRALIVQLALLALAIGLAVGAIMLVSRRVITSAQHHPRRHAQGRRRRPCRRQRLSRPPGRDRRACRRAGNLQAAGQREAQDRGAGARAQCGRRRAPARGRGLCRRVRGRGAQDARRIERSLRRDAQDLGRSLRGVAPDQRPRPGRRQGLQ